MGSSSCIEVRISHRKEDATYALDKDKDKDEFQDSNVPHGNRAGLQTCFKYDSKDALYPGAPSIINDCGVANLECAAIKHDLHGVE